MSRRANAYVVTVLLAIGCALVIPQLGLASTGGAAFGDPATGSTSSPSTTSGTRSASTSSTGVVQRANYTARATGNGITLATRASAMLRHGLDFAGTVPSEDAGKTVEIERRGHQTGWRWTATAHGTAGGDGSFTAHWPANHIGQFDLRAVVELRSGTTQGGIASPAVASIVYRPAIATYYGSGFYGSLTACNVKLTPSTLGTANRTLPCGMKVAVYYNGRMIVVPVIDRGPYANHADWDLTEATARKLGTPGIANVGAVSLPGH